MAYVQENNKGSLFPNDRKETDKHPDMKGTIKVAGVEYWISAWNNDGGRLGLSVKPKDERPAQQKSASAPPPLNEGFDDEIPFAWAWLAILPLAGLLAHYVA